MFSIPIATSFTKLKSYAFQSADYQVLPNSTWAYAVDLKQPLTFINNGYKVSTLES